MSLRSTFQSHRIARALRNALGLPLTELNVSVYIRNLRDGNDLGVLSRNVDGGQLALKPLLPPARHILVFPVPVGRGGWERSGMRHWIQNQEQGTNKRSLIGQILAWLFSGTFHRFPRNSTISPSTCIIQCDGRIHVGPGINVIKLHTWGPASTCNAPLEVLPAWACGSEYKVEMTPRLVKVQMRRVQGAPRVSFCSDRLRLALLHNNAQ